MTEEIVLPIKGCLPKFSGTWRSVFGGFGSANRIHPSDPVPPKNSEFILTESRVQTRVIHLKPEDIRNSSPINQEVCLKRTSLSGEYWFMKSKPMRNVHCNCSFRNSVRKSLSIISCKSPQQKELHYKCNEMKFNISNENSEYRIETYINRLVQDTLSEAMNECLGTNKIKGIDNLAFEGSNTELVLTRVKKQDNKTIEAKSDIQYNSSPSNCLHKRKKPLIIFVHGLGSTADVWNIPMHNLCLKGFEVVAPDLLGHGFSTASNKASLYTFKNLVNQVMAVFDHFMNREDKRKCVLIGHSYGCSVITALYPNRAAKIAQLVLISGGGPTPLAPPADINDISPYGWAHNLCYPFMYCGLKRSFFYSSRGKNFKFCKDNSMVPPHLQDFLMRGQFWPEGDASFHRRILVPTLLVHGLQDNMVSLVQECEMERTIPRSFLELIPDAGHMSMLESPEHLTHMIDCFLEMWS